MNGLRKGHCREVQAVVGGTLYYCHREVVKDTEFCKDHQPRPKVILTCECGKRYVLAGNLLVPIAEENK